MSPDAKCNITYHHLMIAFHPAQKLNICGNVSGIAVNIIDQNNFSGWVLVNKEERICAFVCVYVCVCIPVVFPPVNST